MHPAPVQPAMPRWHFIVPRVLLITFLITLICFAISLFFGILGLLLAAHVRGFHPDMTLAYRHFALPIAVVVALISLIATTAFEVRSYQQMKVLAEVARASR
jgi:hypothetical protein